MGLSGGARRLPQWRQAQEARLGQGLFCSTRFRQQITPVPEQLKPHAVLASEKYEFANGKYMFNHRTWEYCSLASLRASTIQGPSAHEEYQSIFKAQQNYSLTQLSVTWIICHAANTVPFFSFLSFFLLYIFVFSKFFLWKACITFDIKLSSIKSLKYRIQ